MIVSFNGGRLDTSSFLFIMCLLSMIACIGGSANMGVKCIESEKQALLAFKKGLVDPGNRLASWTSGEGDCCSWRHVGCHNLTAHVIKLDLNAFHEERWDPIFGEINPSLLQLPYLSHLDLSNNGFTSVSKVISLSKRLTYLDMSWNNIFGTFPYHLGNLSMLEYLDLSDNVFTADNFEWLAFLSSLQVLNLSDVYFTKAEDWYQAIKLHPSLSTLELSDCDFPKINSSAASITNSSNSLSVLRLYCNTFNTPVLSWLFNLSSALVHLVVSCSRLRDFEVIDNGMKCPIPNSIGDLTWLEHLQLSDNLIEGGIPLSFSKLCHLEVLDLSYNSLSQPIDDIFQNIKCAMNSLEQLDLSHNKLIATGSFPDISEFKSLRELHLDNNLLNGSFSKRLCNSSKLFVLSMRSNRLIGPLPDFEKFPSLVELDVSNNSLSGGLPISIAKLSNLTVLDVSHNSLDGVVAEAHLSTLPNLNELILSHNSLTFNINSDFVPPFHLDHIQLRYCKLGPMFPSWLHNQKRCSFIDISNSQISDIVPHWFWNSPWAFRYLNLSHNQLSGQIPNLPRSLKNDTVLDLSSNLFYGPIPQILFNSWFLDFHNNSFFGSLSFLCETTHSSLVHLDLSHNLLSENLTDCWVHLPKLCTLILESNNFSGIIPSSIGSLANLETLHLRNNNLIGQLPASLRNCSSLKVLDVGENHLTDQLPAWIGESLTDLIVLRLRLNRFYGKISSTICQLSKIQILDLSFNNLSGPIPSCVDSFTSMSNRGIDKTISYSYYYAADEYEENELINYVVVEWKGFEQEYRKTLGLLKLIDLSSNNLIGHIPSEITNLSMLISLNVSRNNLSGFIPDQIGQLKELEVLDLSHNQISGQIPSSLVDINRLSILDLSHNKLLGKIPKGTQLQSFDPSVYLGNSGLCGCPLPIKCAGDNDECLEEKRKQEATTDSSINKDNTKEDEGLLDRSSFFAGMGVGFAAAFSGICSLLIMNTSWRRNYFQLLNKMWDCPYLIVVLKVATRGCNAARSQ